MSSETLRNVVVAVLACAAGLPVAARAESGRPELEEIVVTARKREESVQDIPVVVTAFTADELARRGVSELEDVAAATPGLAFEDFSNGFSAAPVIRGLTQVNVSSEVQNVATFVDGIYLQRNFSVDIGQADLERIEVVKGPQSALYGQNAFAGAINYVLARPGEQFAGYVDVGRAEGASVAFAGTAPNDPALARGFFHPPVIFEARSNDLRISREEIFGPVMTVLPFRDVDEVVRLANDTEYGLAAAIWTRDITKALTTARAVRAGVVWINDSQPAPSETMWGGYKQSGIGRELGPYALDAYLESKHVYVSLG